MEEKKKGILRFLKPSPGKIQKDTAPGAAAQVRKGGNGKKKWVKPVVFLLILGAGAAGAMTLRGMKATAATALSLIHI